MKSMKPKSVTKRYSGAVQATKEEINQMIEQKMRDKVQRQHHLREIFLKRMVKQTRLQILKSRIEESEETNEDVEWAGVKMPFELAQAEYNLDLFYYKTECQQEEYYEQALKNDGFTKDQITAVKIEEKYVTSSKELKHMESDFNKKKVKEQETKERALKLKK